MQVCSPSGHQFSLRKLLPEAEFLGADDILVNACCCDAEQVEPGSLFVALAGPDHDGHDDALEAVARGCAAVLAERSVPGLAVPACFVADAREAYGRVCHALADHPSGQLKTIAVVGNDRTVTACLIASMLNKAGNQVGLMGALGVCDGRRVDASVQTIPPPDELARWLNRMVVNGCSHGVIEISLQALEEARVAGVAFDAVCVSRLRPSGPEDSRGLNGYRLTRSKLLKHLAPQRLTVLNADDSLAIRSLGLIDHPVLTVGIHASAEVTGTIIEQVPSEQTFLLVAGGEGIPVRTAMIGTPHVYACLTAAAVGLSYGLDLPTIARGLEAVDYVPGYLQRIECGQPFSVFVDGARTPETLAAALETLREVNSGRLICVVAAEDREEKRAIRQAIESAVDDLILTSGARRARTIAKTLAKAQPGDCVLIAGKGHEEPFDELRRWCRECGIPTPPSLLG